MADDPRYPLHRPDATGVPASPDLPQIERDVLAYWDADGTFQASIDARPAGENGANEFVFYDGPPFANGLPHYGHLLTGYAKDVVPRYQTMKGRRVERRFGWDTHGLPAELEAQRILGITDTSQIEEMGLAAFNAACRESVLILAAVQRRMSPTLEHLIEGLALQRPRLTAAAVHRQVALVAPELGEAVPSYQTIHLMIQRMDPALMTLAHDGTKSYDDRFDLVHRREAETSNAIWQADHSELDVLVKDGEGKSRKPWLTIVLDDCSRALAGYLLFFGAPSAIQTALALRQAIWRKSQPGWHVCGIPQILYIDHGSDFTSRHLEQVAADLKIRLIFSTAGKPRGRGKIERFFKSLSQVFLSRLPGYAPGRTRGSAVLTLPELDQELERYLIGEYLVTPHRTTKQAPQARWEAGGFLPQMPESLEKLDLLLLTVPKARRIHQDGIRFMGLRYIDPTLAAYVGEDVVLRYDPRDMAEIRVFYHDRFLCRAICQELAGATVTLREIVNARNARRRQLRQTLQERRRLVDSLLAAKRSPPVKQEQESSSPSSEPTPPPVKLKRYFCDE